MIIFDFLSVLYRKKALPCCNESYRHDRDEDGCGVLAFVISGNAFVDFIWKAIIVSS